MLVNPEGQLGVCLYSHDEGYRTYAYEVCDPCQDDAQCYKVDGVWVSDFVYPAWFETWREKSGKKGARKVHFDHKRHLSGPLEIAKGGYAAYVSARKDTWINDHGGHRVPGMDPVDGLARGGSRKLLRAVPRHEWKRSRW